MEQDAREVVESPSVEVFKKKLNRCLFIWDSIGIMHVAFVSPSSPMISMVSLGL